MSISNKGGNFLISYENFENTMDSILDKEEYLKKNNIEIQRVEDVSDTSDTSGTPFFTKTERDSKILASVLPINHINVCFSILGSRHDHF